MAATSQLASYVRFYLSIAVQLEGAWAALRRTHERAQAALTPFAEPLAPLASEALEAALASPPEPVSALKELWRPEDAEGLAGLNDLYEVVGRFSFQGEGNTNLSRTQQVVAAARNEIYDQRMLLTALRELPPACETFALKSAEAETAAAAERRARKLAGLAPLAQTLVARAEQTLEAVRGVPVPKLTEAEGASDEYARYAAKVAQVYATCLPFLAKAISELYAFAACEEPPGFPTELPLVAKLPDELVSVPPEGSSELREAEAGIASLEDEERARTAQRDEITAAYARLEAQHTDEASREQAMLDRVAVARTLVEVAAAAERIAEIDGAIVSLEQQKAQRLAAIGEIEHRTEKRATEGAALEGELAARVRGITETEARLKKEREDEPVLFGKEDWRLRVAAIEDELDVARRLYGERLGALNQLKVDASTLAVAQRTEESQSALVDRWLADHRQRRGTLAQTIDELGKRLGPARPARPPAVADADANLAREEAAKQAHDEGLVAVREAAREKKEEGARVVGRLRQIAQEKERLVGFRDSARVAATQGREVALQRLQARRRAAVEAHVGEVLGALEQSLRQVRDVFVTPAELAIATQETADVTLAERVRAKGTELAVVLAALTAELEPDLLAQDATLGQVQREFCDQAETACRGAWS